MAKLNNQDKQKQLDFIKWNKSQMEKQDLSGKMDYCVNCKYKSINGCTASQEEREAGNLCAKAFNKRSK